MLVVAFVLLCAFMISAVGVICDDPQKANRFAAGSLQPTPTLTQQTCLKDKKEQQTRQS